MVQDLVQSRWVKFDFHKLYSTVPLPLRLSLSLFLPALFVCIFFVCNSLTPCWRQCCNAADTQRLGYLGRDASLGSVEQAKLWFDELDKDKSGFLDREELQLLLKRIGASHSKNPVKVSLNLSSTKHMSSAFKYVHKLWLTHDRRCSRRYRDFATEKATAWRRYAQAGGRPQDARCMCGVLQLGQIVKRSETTFFSFATNSNGLFSYSYYLVQDIRNVFQVWNG